MSEKPTKERILDAAEELMLENSFHSVGLNQILKAVNVPKGSFYHHFQSKEEFGVELLKHYIAKSHSCLEAISDENPLTRFLTFFEGLLAAFNPSSTKCPCLIVKLTAEVGSFSDDMRETLAKHFTSWIAKCESILREAVDQKLLRSDFDCSAHAQILQDLWFGSMQRAITIQSDEPMRNTISLFRSILAQNKP